MFKGLMLKIKSIKNISIGILVLYAIAVGIIMLHAGQPTSIKWFIGGLPMLAWAVGPIFLFLLFISIFDSYVAKIILIVLQIIFSLFSLCVYYYAFYIQTGPQYAQNGLTFIFLPFFQYVAINIIALMIKVIQLINKKIR